MIGTVHIRHDRVMRNVASQRSVVGAISRRRNSQYQVGFNQEMAGLAVICLANFQGVAADPVIVTTADAPTRKLASGFFTWIRTGKRCAKRTQSRLRGTLGNPMALVPSSGTTAQA